MTSFFHDAHGRWPLARRLGRTAWSLLLGGIAVLGAILVFRQGLLPLIAAGFHPGPEGLSLVRRTGILLAAIGGYWAYVHWHERRPVTELHLRLLPLVLGGAGGAALIALPIALLFAGGAYQLVQYRGFSPALFGVAALLWIAAMLEEIVYRALAFRVLERYWGTGVALVLQAVLFAVPHLENVAQGDRRDAIVMLVTTIVLGVVWALVFALTRNLWVAVANHAAWNFTILLSGVPLSGIEDWRALAPLESRYAGSAWLTGGLFGPESSLLVIALATGAMLILLRVAKQRGVYRPMPLR